MVGACSKGDASSAASASSGSAVCDAMSVTGKVLPSVVTITATGGATTLVGSGNVLRDDGHIVTNDHVVAPAGNGGTIHVVFSNGTAAPATIVGRDPQTDLAVIKVTVNSDLTAITPASGAVQIGQPVVALGAPLGLANTVTTGIVSAFGRTVELDIGNGHTAVLLSALQTDAAINPGNSGGALTDCAGKLVGIPSATATIPGASGGGSIGLGFAIPVELAQAVADELIASGSVTHSYFGLDVATVPVPGSPGSGHPQGLYVTAVAAGGPSAVAGLAVGDVITAVEGKAATSPTQLALLTLTKKPGETVGVTYDRAGTSTAATITLAPPP
jgi:putative serine protease PepD